MLIILLLESAVFFRIEILFFNLHNVMKTVGEAKIQILLLESAVFFRIEILFFSLHNVMKTVGKAKTKLKNINCYFYTFLFHKGKSPHWQMKTVLDTVVPSKVTVM